ncbi:MAG: DUF4241 domain-containing protein, partial [Myxococcota bacterium]|nr:DUF4241 domain-containing protein [Myxococcota bacterium]
PKPLSAQPPAKLPLVAVKPAKASAPSQPLPPAPPAPAAHRDEMIAPRDIARLLRYGEHFGPHKIDIRMLQMPLPVASTAIAICDPATAKSWRVFDRPVNGGAFRVMLSVARTGEQERLAAVVIHVGRPPIAKWTVAHFQGQKKPKAPDQLARAVSAGWLALVDAGSGSPGVITVPAAAPAAPTNLPVAVPLADGRHALAVPCGAGDYAAYWAVDATDKPICLVLDFDVFTQKEWKAKPT